MSKLMVTSCGRCGRRMHSGECKHCKNKPVFEVIMDGEQDAEIVETTGWRAAVDSALTEFKYGDMISHAWLLKMFGVTLDPDMPASEHGRERLRAMHAFQMFRETLLVEHKRDLKNVRGEGYLVIVSDQQTDEAMTDFSDAFARETARARRRLENVNTDGLSAKKLRERDEAIGRLAAIEAFAGPKLPPPRSQMAELSEAAE